MQPEAATLTMPPAASKADGLWYKDAVVYQLHVRAFNDSSGDGIGDFRGAIEKLDYLKQLGVTALWLLPFYPSPLRDDGYDIADYLSVNPSYGTLEDFKEFLDEAHARLVLAVHDRERGAEHGHPEHRDQEPPDAQAHAAILSATRSTALRARGLRAISSSEGMVAPPIFLSRGRACGGTCGRPA